MLIANLSKMNLHYHVMCFLFKPAWIFCACFSCKAYKFL